MAAIWEEHSIKSGKRQSIPLPNGYLFEIHGSILEPHPSGHPGQTSVVCISHGVLFFCVSKDTLNGFFSHGINFLATLGFTQLFHQIKIFLPDMCGKHPLSVFVCSANCSAWTVFTDFSGTTVSSLALFAGGRVLQFVASGTDKAVIYQVIGEIPGTESVVLSFVACIG